MFFFYFPNRRKRGEKNEDTVQNLIVRKLTLERVNQLKDLIEKERQECEELKQKVDQLSDEKIDDELLDELNEQMLKEQDQQAEGHESHQRWLKEREDKYAAMMVGKQKGLASSVRAKQDLHNAAAQLPIATSIAAASVSTVSSTPLSVSPSVATSVKTAATTTFTIAAPAAVTVTTDSTKITTDVNTAHVSMETKPSAESSSTFDTSKLTEIATNAKNESGVVIATEPAKTTEVSVAVSKDEQPEDSPTVSATVSDPKSPSVISSLLRSPNHKSPTAVLADATTHEQSASETVFSAVEMVANNETTDPSTAAEETTSVGLPTKESNKKSNVEEEDVSVEQHRLPSPMEQDVVAEEPVETEQTPTEKPMEVVEESVSNVRNMEEDSSDTQPFIVQTDKDSKKNEKDQLLEKADTKCFETKSPEEIPVNESRSESSKRKRISSVISGPGPTRRSGRFKPVRTAAEENKSSESPSVTSGLSAQTTSTTAATDGHLSDSGSAVVSGASQSASQDGSILISGSKVTDLNENANMSGTPSASAIASALLEGNRKGTSTHSDETNDSITSDSETLGRGPGTGGGGGPPSRALSISESIPNSPASAISDDPEVIKEYKAWKKSILLLWRQAATHKYSSLFTQPVTDDDAKGYSEVVYRPIDLTMIRKRIESGQIRSTAEFQHDMMLLFQNAIMYNNVKHEVHQMAVEMQKEILDSIDDFVETQSTVTTSSSVPTLFNMAVLVTPPTSTYSSSTAAATTVSGTPTTTIGSTVGGESRSRVCLGFLICPFFLEFIY